MSLIFDIFLILIIALSLIIGWKRGFFKSMIDMFSTLIAMIATVLTYRYAAIFLHKKVFLPRITRMIKNLITANGKSTDISLMFREKKTVFTDIIDRFSDMSEVEKYYKTVKDSKGAADKVSEFMASPISNAVSRLAAFLIVFIIAILLVNVLAAMLRSTLSLPVLKQADSVVGLVFGAIIGVTISWALSIVTANALGPLTALHPEWFPAGKSADQLINNTLLLRLLYRSSPQEIIDYFIK